MNITLLILSAFVVCAGCGPSQDPHEVGQRSAPEAPRISPKPTASPVVKGSPSTMAFTYVELAPDEIIEKVITDMFLTNAVARAAVATANRERLNSPPTANLVVGTIGDHDKQAIITLIGSLPDFAPRTPFVLMKFNSFTLVIVPGVSSRTHRNLYLIGGEPLRWMLLGMRDT